MPGWVVEGGIVTMPNMTHHLENDFAEATLTCSGLNLPKKKEEGKKGWKGLFYLPPSVYPLKCDHVFETEDGYRHIVDTMSISAT